MLVGIDEVGRGCLAGPVAAGAVVLGKKIRGLKDSKKLTRQQRETLDIKIRASAIAYGVGWASVEEINQFGLTEAVRLAMHRALACIASEFDEIIIDGNYNFFKEDSRSRTVIHADDLVPAVSAASIIAKVARDAYMRSIAVDFPNHGFDKHVGYATAMHRAALKLHGLTAIHRTNFKPVAELI